MAYCNVCGSDSFWGDIGGYTGHNSGCEHYLPGKEFDLGYNTAKERIKDNSNDVLLTRLERSAEFSDYNTPYSLGCLKAYSEEILIRGLIKL